MCRQSEIIDLLTVMIWSAKKMACCCAAPFIRQSAALLLAESETIRGSSAGGACWHVWVHQYSEFYNCIDVEVERRWQKLAEGGLHLSKLYSLTRFIPHTRCYRGAKRTALLAGGSLTLLLTQAAQTIARYKIGVGLRCDWGITDQKAFSPE